MVKTIIIFVLIYFFFLPVIVTLTPWLFKQLKNRLLRTSRQRQQQTTPSESYLKKAKPAITFILKLDKRSTLKIPNKILIILIYLTGLILSVVAGFLSNPVLLGLSLLFPFIVVTLSRILFAPIKNGRESVYEKIYSLKRDRMGLVNRGNNNSTASQYDGEFEILDWDDDYISPLKIKLFIPTNFDPLAEAPFLEQFNVYLSKGSAKWAPDRTNPDDMGWNYNAGHVTIRRMPPLPSKAIWNEHYLLNDKIAWSFFPLALGVENGVKLHNDETGKDEFVLGFDVAGAQSKMKDVQVGAEVVQAPMVLIAGGTGGGKSLSVDTQVPTVVEV